MSADSEFNHGANVSPRSGSSKQISPVVWCVVTIALVAVITYFFLH